MSYPSSSLTTLRPDLGSMFEFSTEANIAKMVGYQILPIINTAKQSGTFGRIPSESLGKLDDVTRGKNGEYNRVNWNFTEDTFATKEYGLESSVDDRNSSLYSEFIDAEAATTRIVLHKVLAKAESRIASAIFNTTTFTGASLTTNISVEWSTIATATPITDVFNASQKVRDNCGEYANALVVSRKVWRNLIRCAQIIDSIRSSGAGQSTQAGQVTVQQVAEALDLQRIIIGDMSYDSAKEGQSTSFGDMWDDEYAMVCKLASTDMIEEPCLGRTFHWAGDGSQPGGLVESYDEVQSRSRVIRVRHEVQEKIIYPECGHLLTNITA